MLLFVAGPACAQEFAPAPMSVPPLMAPTPKKIVPAAHAPVTADRHVESTALGFDSGIGPAVGRVVTYRRNQYEVTDISVAGGGPTFSGGSHFAIAPAGRKLIVGLKAVDPEKLASLPEPSSVSLN